ncbi:MAG: two-component system, chemotaxis family, chemotaxis protein CheY [Actinomycetota bacterium]|jgi:two-component system chemotaxis response regulator CheY|nr:two-component system, chemotaxis family, chemotaxis protein CheY [Actinomycetota bacterium]MDQ1539361.1 two-component system, chemotaxis family, chemotaxis protein CheY [Actinomycetota bacterium]
MRILIVDDSKAMRMIVARTLRLAGYDEHEFVEASNGRHALEVVADEPPDVVLCDWNMPEMSGLELLTSLRSAGWSIPFGFVTSEASPHMRAAAMDAGALFLIAKPFTAQDFQDALDPMLA